MTRFFLFGLTACASGGSAITSASFYDLPIGMTSSELVSAVGEPYAIHHKADGTVEYEYIERMKIGSRDAEEKHYYLLIREGRVSSKRVEQNSPPPYLFDSFEMQTTQTDSDSEE